MQLKIILGVLAGLGGLLLFSGENNKSSKSQEKPTKPENENQPIVINNYIQGEGHGRKKGNDTQKEKSQQKEGGEPTTGELDPNPGEPGSGE